MLQGEPVSDDIDCSSLLQLIELPAVEYAINFELMQRLVATKFEKPKGKGTGNDKEERIYAACNPWSTGQEALILRASHFSHNETSAQTAGSELVKKRNGQYEAQLEILLESLKTAQQIRKNMAGDYQKFTEWKAQVISNYYGDLDTTSDMIKLITKVEQVQSPAQPNPEGEEPNPRHVAAKLNKLAEELVNLKRSHRFLKIFCNVQCSVTKLSKRNNTSHGFTCAACNTGNLGPGAVTLLSKCGHLVCDQQCLPLDNGACPVAHCSSTNMAHHKIPGHVLGKGSCPEDRSKHGKKLEKILELIERIPDDDKILLFIQSPTLVRILKSILVEGRILFSQLSGGANDPKVLEEFQNGVVRKKNGEASKVLILNIGNSSAAGR
jgi:hypothetical protein